MSFVILKRLMLAICLSFVLASCGGQAPAARITIAPTQIGAGAPVYTATPTLTPSDTATVTATPTASATPTATSTATATATPTATSTATATETPPPTATTSLLTLTPVNLVGAPAPVTLQAAPLSLTSGWSCVDFPCEQDIVGFLQRIRTAPGFELSFVGRFPGQVRQIISDASGRIYATVLENGSQSGAVYVLQPDGTPSRYSATIQNPVGLALQPGTDVLYVTGRMSAESGGALFRVQSDGTTTPVLETLPCCFNAVSGQPYGIVFGMDGWLYLASGSITDHGESLNPAREPFAETLPEEAAILRINPHTAEIQPYAYGLHNSYDLDFDGRGQFYATDTGLATGIGDRIVRVLQGAHYGWPYYRLRGCADCPPTRGALTIEPDLLALPDFTLPHGIVAYRGTQFPANMQNTLLVAFWNATPNGQRIVWIDPADPLLGSPEYSPLPFVTGLIRPIDLTVDVDGSLLIADFVYGHIWRVRYTGAVAPADATPTPSGFVLPTVSADAVTATPAVSGFVTSTPLP